jgi:integrase
MSGYQVEQFIMQNGERYPMLVGENGIPHYWVTLYMTCEVRNEGKKQNTMNSFLYDLSHFMLWEEVNQRDVLSEFLNQKFLTEYDAISIRDFCFLNTKEARKWYRKGSTKKVRKLDLQYPIAPVNIERVDPGHVKTRYGRITSYLLFTAKEMMKPRPNYVVILDSINAMEAVFEQNKPVEISGTNHSDPDKKAPKPEVFNEFLSAVLSFSEKNPYRDHNNRVRNAAIFALLDETGMRGAELLTLTLNSVTWLDDEPVVSIEKPKKDAGDKRKRKPSIKTEERDIPIRPEIANLVYDYIMNERANTEGSDQHNYIFISHIGDTTGRPLTLGGLSYVVSSGVKRVARQANTYKKEDLIKEIRKHGFRHNFNYRISVKFDTENEISRIKTGKNKYNEKQEIETRMYLNGWRDEATARIYNIRHTKEIAHKLQMADMDRLSKVLRRLKK